MARRLYIQDAAPYAQVNSTWYMASVKINHLGHTIIVPCHLPAGKSIPTNQAEIMEHLQGQYDGETIVVNDANSMQQATFEITGSIDGMKATIEHLIPSSTVPTESI